MRYPLSSLVLVAGLLLGNSGQAAEPTPYSGLYAFGDSLSDIGNTLFLTQQAPPPSTYFQGRFANGLIWIDYLAAELGLPPPQTGAAGFTPSTDHSVSFAFGGSGTGFSNELPVPVPVIGLLGQVELFTTALAGQPADPAALYTVWSGANDYLFSQPPPATLPGIPFPPDPPTTVNNILTAISELYALGARHFLVPNLPDLGAVPLVAATPVSPVLSELTLIHNALLAQALPTLEASLPGSRIQLLDVHTLLAALLADPLAYGFVAPALQPGPAAGCLFPPFQCPPLDFTADTVFWDEEHPTSAVHALIAQTALAALPEPVALAIRPGLGRSVVNPRSHSVLTVAILSDSIFNALDIDPATVRFGPAAAAPLLHPRTAFDVDRDGDADLLLAFRLPETGIACGQTAVSLTGATVTGGAVSGWQPLLLVGCRWPLR